MILHIYRSRYFLDCKDSDNGAVDSLGRGCDKYFTKGWCGFYDTNTFKSRKMCCFCGDGKRVGSK